MNINNIEKNKEINLNNSLTNEKEQKNFLENIIGKSVNTAIDIGIRAILPEFFEDQVINIKNNLIEFGLKEGITKTIDDAINLGKSAVGIVTGNFENISQMQGAIKKGGLIDGISTLLDTVVEKTRRAGVINNKIANTIKQGKNIILSNIENNIENTFNNQYQSIEDTNKYIESWKKYFNEQNFKGMEKEYKKIKNKLKSIAPIEKTISEAKKLDILHNLIKNNGQNFNLSKEQLELVEKLK